MTEKHGNQVILDYGCRFHFQNGYDDLLLGAEISRCARNDMAGRVKWHLLISVLMGMLSISCATSTGSVQAPA